MTLALSNPQTPSVGILILNYHQPEATLSCVRRLFEREGPETRLFWLENDAEKTLAEVYALLDTTGIPWLQVDPQNDPLPPVGWIGLIPIPKNLGYAGGNNVGLRYLDRHKVEFAWIMNNDTLLRVGNSTDLVRTAATRPEVALWGMWVSSPDTPKHIGVKIQLNDFAVARVTDPQQLESDPMGFINGCAMFMRTKIAMMTGGIPEEYFMYYEDQAFTWEIRKHGFKIAAIEGVEVFHRHSLSTGHRSRFTEFYCRRNRWHFIHKYFSEYLQRQERLFWLYQTQKLFFRLKFARIHLEWQAYLAFKKGQFGQAPRYFPDQ